MPTPLQLKAGQENWCIYVLKGQRSFVRAFLRGIVPPEVRNHLLNAIDDTIALIKYRQQERNEK